MPWHPNDPISHAISAAELARTLGSATPPPGGRCPARCRFCGIAAFDLRELLPTARNSGGMAAQNCRPESRSSSPACTATKSAKRPRRSCARPASMRAISATASRAGSKPGYPHLRKTATYDGTRSTLLDHPGAAEDRPYRLPVADPPLHRSAARPFTMCLRIRSSPKQARATPFRSTFPASTFSHRGETCTFRFHDRGFRTCTMTALRIARAHHPRRGYVASRY